MQLRRSFHRIGLVGLVPLCVLSLPFFAFAVCCWSTVDQYEALSARAYEGVFASGAFGVAALVSGALWYLAFWAFG